MKNLLSFYKGKLVRIVGPTTFLVKKYGKHTEEPDEEQQDHLLYDRCLTEGVFIDYPHFIFYKRDPFIFLGSHLILTREGWAFVEIEFLLGKHKGRIQFYPEEVDMLEEL